MLSLNIKSSSYMCLDIDPDSVIHKHLVKKVTDLTVYTGSTFNKIISKEFPENNHDHHGSKHNLTMLPSFHISLGAPDDETVLINKYNSGWNEYISFSDIVPIIGDITLAPIVISEKDNKKSAWIPLNPHWFALLTPPSITKHLNDFDSFNKRLKEKNVNNKIINQCTFKHLHVSLANLTGNPHDSIARPEDCIIDTITA